MRDVIASLSSGALAAAAVAYAIASTRRHRADTQLEEAEQSARHIEVVLTDSLGATDSVSAEVRSDLLAKFAELRQKIEKLQASAGQPYWVRIVVAFAGVISAVAVPVVTDIVEDEPPSDCVGYVRLLADLQHEGVDPKVFGKGRLKFGDLEHDCGPPEAMFGP